ncbi:uncharacterized protein [Lepisosteus oculatus]|uniref:uncharacterized protein n=1 Tax=Lepisosteus oculatus TaxID=7918 RepID=UPI00371D833F
MRNGNKVCNRCHDDKGTTLQGSGRNPTPERGRPRSALLQRKRKRKLMSRSTMAAAAAAAAPGSEGAKQQHKTVQDVLVEALDNLTRDARKRFRTKLCDTEFRFDGLAPMTWEQVEKAKHSTDLAAALLRYYTERRALPLAVNVMTAVGENQLAETLREEAARRAPKRKRRAADPSPAVKPEAPKRKRRAADPSPAVKPEAPTAKTPKTTEERATVAQLLDFPVNSFPPPVAVRVVQKSKQIPYVDAQEKKKKRVCMSLADQEGAIRATAFDMQKACLLRKNKFFVLKGYKMKEFKGKPSLAIGERTEIVEMEEKIQVPRLQRCLLPDSARDEVSSIALAGPRGTRADP